MGACRSLNLLVGMSQASDLGGPVAWSAAIAFGCFVMGITWISRSEVLQGGLRGIAWGMFWQNVGLLGLVAVSDPVTVFIHVPRGLGALPRTFSVSHKAVAAAKVHASHGVAIRVHNPR